MLQRAYQGYPPQEHPPCSVALRMHLRMHRSTTTQYHRMYHTPWHPPCGRSTWYHVYYHHSVPSGWCVVTTRAMAWWSSPGRYHVPCVRTARCIPTVCSYPRTVGHTVGCPGEVLQRAYQGYPPQEHPPCSVALRMHLRMHRSTTTQYHRMYHTPWHPPCGRSTWYHAY